MPSPRKPTSTCTCALTRARSPSSATSAARPSGHKVPPGVLAVPSAMRVLARGKARSCYLHYRHGTKDHDIGPFIDCKLRFPILSFPLPSLPHQPGAHRLRRACPIPEAPTRSSPLSPLRVAASLDKHNRTHTGERPFGCEFCEQRFTEKGPLLRHVASRHQEGRPHFCQICSKTFKGNGRGTQRTRGPSEPTVVWVSVTASCSCLPCSR